MVGDPLRLGEAEVLRVKVAEGEREALKDVVTLPVLRTLGEREMVPEPEREGDPLLVAHSVVVPVVVPLPVALPHTVAVELLEPLTEGLALGEGLLTGEAVAEGEKEGEFELETESDAV